LRETVHLIEQAGGRAIGLTADVTDRQAVEEMTHQVEQQLGPVDLLVNNAGRWKLVGEAWELDAEQWWREIEVNLRGPYLCARAVLPGMVNRRRGRIINVASGGGLQAVAYGSAYGISKTAMIRLSEQLAVETKERGISVFAIHPGTVRTPMTAYWLETGMAALPAPVAQRCEWFCKIFEEDRDTPVQEPVQLVLFLASGQADALSGCFITVHDDVAEMTSQGAEIQESELYRLRLST
jgi:NAD(P)-dependent dehydrogenase (short-subunit alcohol dehydrogenase family)